MTELMTCLYFDRGQAREAAEFYASVFPDSHVGNAHAYSVDFPAAKEGEDLLVEFTVLGQAYVGLNGGPEFTPNEAVSFMVVTEDQEETDRLWASLTNNGGKTSQCGWLEDRFGVSWQVIPKRLPDLLAHSDANVVQRVSQAMMQMSKIDIADLEVAAGMEANHG